MQNKNYEWIELPSKGMCYSTNSPLRKGKVKVAYLTAMDENILNNPTLYQSGKLLDVIIERKVVDKSIDTYSLCVGDREAIALWLRRTSYGDFFPVVIKDNNKNIQVSDIIDLSKIKYSDFYLVGDEDGHFLYFTKNNDILKFKFLSKNDVDELVKQIKNDDYYSIIKTFLKKITLSVNNTLDKCCVDNYIDNMPIEEITQYKNFVLNNMPQIENIVKLTTIEGEEIHLQIVIDDSIFFNVQ